MSIYNVIYLFLLIILLLMKKKNKKKMGLIYSQLYAPITIKSFDIGYLVDDTRVWHEDVCKLLHTHLNGDCDHPKAIVIVWCPDERDLQCCPDYIKRHRNFLCICDDTYQNNDGRAQKLHMELKKYYINTKSTFMALRLEHVDTDLTRLNSAQWKKYFIGAIILRLHNATKSVIYCSYHHNDTPPTKPTMCKCGYDWSNVIKVKRKK